MGQMREFDSMGEVRSQWGRDTMLRYRNPTSTKHTFPLQSWQPAAAFTDFSRAVFSRNFRRAPQVSRNNVKQQKRHVI